MSDDTRETLTDLARERRRRVIGDQDVYEATVLKDGSYLMCLECGTASRRHQRLRRHLLAEHRMREDTYRKRWGLPADYPMVAPLLKKLEDKLRSRQEEAETT